MNKVINYILSIETFEQQCDALKGVLQLLCLKYPMKTIGTDNLVRNIASFEQKYLNNIKNIYQLSGKWDDKQKFKYTLEAAIVSTP